MPTNAATAQVKNIRSSAVTILNPVINTPAPQRPQQEHNMQSALTRIDQWKYDSSSAKLLRVSNTTKITVTIYRPMGNTDTYRATSEESRDVDLPIVTVNYIRPGVVTIEPPTHTQTQDDAITFPHDHNCFEQATCSQTTGMSPTLTMTLQHHA